jgi:hypothetical protein
MKFKRRLVISDLIRSLLKFCSHSLVDASSEKRFLEIRGAKLEYRTYSLDTLKPIWYYFFSNFDFRKI